MSLEADRKYAVVVKTAALVESESGTPGIELTFGCDEGSISHTLWITDKTRERIEDNLTTLGITVDQIKNPDTLRNIDSVLRDRECSITTKDEEYNGKTRLKVQWINPLRKPVSAGLADRMAAMFGGNSAPPGRRGAAASAGPAPFRPEISDDDLPF